MKRRTHIRGFPRSIAAALAYIWAMSAQAQEYLVFDLGVASELSSAESYAFGINNLNFVVGKTDVGENPEVQAFIWVPFAQTAWDSPFNAVGLSPFGVDDTEALKINDDSVVIVNQPFEAFGWQANGTVATWTDFELNQLPDVLDGDEDMQAYGLDFESSPLRIVGRARYLDEFDEEYWDGFVWRSNNATVSTRLNGPKHNNLGGKTYHGAYGISPQTKIGAGGTDFYGAGSFPMFGLEWDLDSSTSGTELPPLPSQTDSGQALDATDDGFIVGQLEDEAVTKQHAALWNWDDAGDLVDLHDDASPPLSAAHQSVARAMRNNALQIVGANTSTSKALLWQWNDGEQHWDSLMLNSTIVICDTEWSFAAAHDVNERGWIVGWGLHNGEVRALLLVPRDRPCRADVTGPAGVPDGFVDVTDLLAVLGAWGECDACDQCQMDVDDDGEVGTPELLAVLADWSDVRFACDGNGDVPETIQDCIDKIGYGNPEALEACIEFVTGGS